MKTYLFSFTEIHNVLVKIYGLSIDDALAVVYLCLKEQYGVVDNNVEGYLLSKNFSQVVILEDYAKQPMIASTVYMNINIPPNATNISIYAIDMFTLQVNING